MSPTASSDTPPALGPVLSVAGLNRAAPRPISLSPSPESCAALARDLGIEGLRKLRFEGELTPLGRRDWRLQGQLGATVVQPCVVTFAPVTTRIEEPVLRLWRADWQTPEAEEMEVPENVDEEPLGGEIDIGAVIAEALALALPAFPRAEGAALETAVFTEPGKAAMTDDEARPFAGLAGLREQLDGADSQGGDRAGPDGETESDSGADPTAGPTADPASDKTQDKT